MAQVTWAWLRADRRRVAWRQNLCIDCFSAYVLALDTEQAPEGALTCPGCHMGVTDELDPVYCTAYVPHTGKVRFEIPTCGACAVEVRNKALRHAVQLEDREPESRGQAPGAPSPVSAWAALGIVPNA